MSKIQDGGGLHLKKFKNRHISAAVQPILTKFDKMMHFEHLDRPDSLKFKILQIQDGGGRHLENRKIVISQPRFEWFRRNLAWWCSMTLLTVPTVKNLKFQNPRWRQPPSWKIAISWPRFDRLCRNLARWRISNLLTVPNVKYLKFCKSKMAAKNYDISATVWTT